MATAKTKTKKATPAEPKEWDLNPGQYLLYNNDKGDNPKRPDLRGPICLEEGSTAQISAWKKWTITNEMKLEGTIQDLSGAEPNTLGRFKLYTASASPTVLAEAAAGPAMVGKAEIEGKPMAMTLRRQTAKDGSTYFAGYVNEIAQQRIDPLADATPDQDDFNQDFGIDDHA